MTKQTLSGPSRKPRSGGIAKQLVILLHGWGADGPNLIDLADLFAPTLPDAHFISPNAPYPCEANPYGFQWFSLMDRQPQHLLAGVRDAAEILNGFIDEQLASLSLDNSKLAFIGFSQGTMTALHVALRRSPQIAAVVGFSGSLIGPDELAKEITDMDDVVPYASMERATMALAQHGITPETHTRPYLGHSIDMEGAKAAASFLGKNLS